jgi:hypothetical protein
MLCAAAESKAVLLSVVRSAPFLAQSAELPAAGPVRAAAFSPVDQVLSLTCAGGAVDAWRLPPRPRGEGEDAEEGAGEEGAAAAPPAGADAAPPEPPAPPARVLWTAPREGSPMVCLCTTPKPRRVGALAESECGAALVPFIGTGVLARFRIPRAPPPEGADPAAPEAALQLPSAISAAALDRTTAMICTGLASGTLVVRSKHPAAPL